MSMPARRADGVSVDAFLAFLDREPGDARYELVDGQIVAMAGGSMAHDAVASNVAARLLPFVRERGCRVFRGDVGVRRADADDFLAYPDGFVRCGPVDRSKAVTDPLLVVEVLSPSTIDYDRGQKLIQYKQIPSVRQILLIDQDRPLVESWVRGEDGAFERHVVTGLDGTVPIPALDGMLTMTAIYEDVPFEA